MIPRDVTSFESAIPSLMLLVVVMGGIIGGVFTATDAAAVAVAYALVLALVYKGIRISDLPNGSPGYCRNDRRGIATDRHVNRYELDAGL